MLSIEFVRVAAIEWADKNKTFFLIIIFNSSDTTPLGSISGNCFLLLISVIIVTNIEENGNNAANQ